jgi:four helix bundle protein
MQGRTQRKHEKLEVWQDSMALVVLVYRLIATLPTTEKFGLVLQMQRASVSISLNIAEGAARGTTKIMCVF